jgi:restriction system protein
MNKTDKLKNLATKRKNATLVGCKNVHEFQNGKFDTEFNVSPWTNSAKNVDADLMLIGQDWASEDWLNDPLNLQFASLGRNPNLETNKNIDKYLKFFDLQFQDIYATNAFVFIKQGQMSSAISDKIFYECVVNYSIPQIEIVRPKMIICLGAKTLNSVRKAIGKPPIKVSNGHIEFAEYEGAKIFGTYHAGGMGTANAGGKQNAEQIWKLLAQEYKKIMDV